MSLQDSIFAEEVENDITLFAEDARQKRYSREGGGGDKSKEGKQTKL